MRIVTFILLLIMFLFSVLNWLPATGNVFYPRLISVFCLICSFFGMVFIFRPKCLFRENAKEKKGRGSKQIFIVFIIFFIAILFISMVFCILNKAKFEKMKTEIENVRKDKVIEKMDY